MSAYGRSQRRPDPVVWAAVAAALGPAGCDARASAGNAPPDGVAVTIRDSAGVENAEKHAPERPVIAPRVGEVFRDCEACPMMIVLPAGTFLMGSPESETEGSGAGTDGERPRHAVMIGAPFAIGAFEVTFAEWDACFRDGDCGANPPDDAGWGRDRRPVINVSWQEAQGYAQWLAGETGEGYRLPSEAEWEYAARAGTESKRHWGDDLSGQCRHANGYDLDAAAQLPPSPNPDFRPVTCRDGYVYTAPVGSFGPSAFGLYDILGNVAEWTEDCWRTARDRGHDARIRFKAYDGAPDDGSAWTEGPCDQRVIRGGHWGSRSRSIRSASRFPQDAPVPQDTHGGLTDYAFHIINRVLGGAGTVTPRSPSVGFRVVRDIPDGV